jgi:hypothetical protein
MNRYKLQYIVEHIRGYGRFPTNQEGEPLDLDDMLVWYGLRDLLPGHEQHIVKQELRALVEAEAFKDRLRRMRG